MILALTRLLPSPDQSQQHLIMKGILHCIVHNNKDNAKEKIFQGYILGLPVISLGNA